jgi:glucose-6-phosphate dehydrogenase assembly protein OpcA
MAIQTPLVSLQAPKDVSLGQIEAELGQIWAMYNQAQGDGSGAMRAATFTLVIYEPEETQKLLAALGFYNGPVDGIHGPQMASAIRAAQRAYGLTETGKSDGLLLEELRRAISQSTQRSSTPHGPAAAGAIADAIASQNPCRIIALLPTAGDDEGVKAQVSAYCPIQKRNQSTLICCEYITLQGTESALERVSGMVASLVISDLPRFLWWKADPSLDNPLLRKLASQFNSVVVDSSKFLDVSSDLLGLQTLAGEGIKIIDLNWARLAPWQELTAEAFDPPQRRAAIGDVDLVTIDFEKGNPTQALMFLSWLASRLSWRPTQYRQSEADLYDLHHIQLVTADQRVVQVELAGVPTGDCGDVVGDLIGLRLASTNPDADCCTILCSETMGCMHLESGGKGQNCRVNQVSSLGDQNAELLLSQQLQRWGRDLLYEETMAVACQILQQIEAN